MTDTELIDGLEGLLLALDNILDDLDQLTIQDDQDATTNRRSKNE